MKVYLAARYSRRLEMLGVAGDLHALGHDITSRWIQGSHQVPDEGLSAEAEPTLRQRFAAEDLHDLLDADVCLSFTEPPRSANSRGGRHVEFGIALGMGKRLLVVGHRENVFHCLPAVEFFPDWSACWKQLQIEALEAAEAMLRREALDLVREAAR